MDIRTLLRICLERRGGMTVLLAGSGEEGLRLARAERPDLIVLDVMMPLMDGPSTFVALRGSPSTANIPVVFLTAQAGAAVLDDLAQLGAADVLMKPFEPEALPAMLLAARDRWFERAV